MSASQLVDLLGTPHAMYAVVDSNAFDSVYSSVASLGASLAEVPVASVGTCVDTSPGAAPEDASLSFTLDSGASHCFFRDCTTLTPLPKPGQVAAVGVVAAAAGEVAGAAVVEGVAVKLICYRTGGSGGGGGGSGWGGGRGGGSGGGGCQTYML
ncbi:unnamed protein product [Closterium sp. NIES-54]